jgi:hypothetical protein
MDILNAYHGLAQVFFPISPSEDVSAFSFLSDSINEKPYVPLY